MGRSGSGCSGVEIGFRGREWTGGSRRSVWAGVGRVFCAGSWVWVTMRPHLPAQKPQVPCHGPSVGRCGPSAGRGQVTGCTRALAPAHTGPRVPGSAASGPGGACVLTPHPRPETSMVIGSRAAVGALVTNPGPAHRVLVL